MAYRDFWENVRGAFLWMDRPEPGRKSGRRKPGKTRGPKSGAGPGPSADGGAEPESEAARRKHAADVWLNARTTAGYDPADFDFLDEDERDELTRRVAELRSLLAEIPPDELPSVEAIARARPIFLRIAALLDFDHHADAAALSLGKRLSRRVRDALPDWVQGLRFETGWDVIGDPALTLWVVAPEDFTRREDWFPRFMHVAEALRKRVAELAPEMFPYIHLTSPETPHRVPGAA